MHQEKSAIRKRLRRIEGQVRGIDRMIEEERYCIDVLTQLQAVKAALVKVEDAILNDHAATCVLAAIETVKITMIFIDATTPNSFKT